ncbi:hypothetical protein AB0M43_33625 [Longispora sp. NPDC051575]|uniref:hypothetical protein n=1 Tax=Longispora sp. NPDC051575 TaxID=3154943 RepID=UPI003412128F
MTTEPTGQEPTTPTAPAPAVAPWERDGTPFDPGRAWALIEGLRADLTKAKTPAPVTPVPPAAPAAPAAAPAVPAAATVEADLAALRAELARERLARKHGLDDDLVSLLGTGTEAEIAARAELLAARLGAAPATPAAPPVARRPVEVRAGSDPTGGPVEETDPAKLAAAVRARRPF